MSTEKQPDRPKVFKIHDFVDQREIMGRIYSVMGVEDVAELARKLDKPYQTIGHYEKGDRSIPWDLIFQALRHTDKGLDWLILGREPVQIARFTGNPTVTASSGTQQIAGANIAPGAAISNCNSGQQIKPEMERIIQILEHYGSPALYRKIEQMITEMYGKID